MTTNLPCKECLIVPVCQQRYSEAAATSKYEPYPNGRKALIRHCDILNDWFMHDTYPDTSFFDKACSLVRFFDKDSR